MRLRTAIPILFVSLALMVGGLSFARAQQQPVVPQVPLDTQRRLQIQQNPALERQIQEAGLKQQKQPQETPPQEEPREGGGRDIQTPPNIRPFQSGLESDDDDDCARTRPTAPITFNLEDADLPDLIRLISQITCKRFILPGKTRSIKATVYAPTKVTPNEAYQAFLSILQLNGMTVVPSGRYLKVVESQNIENQVTPVNTGGSPSPADDRFVTRMHRVENISAEDAATLLTRFKSPEGQVSAYAPTNTLILTDMGSNIRRMLRIIESVDVPRTGEQIWIERIHYVDASELATLLTELFPVGQPTGGGAGPSNVQARPSPPRSSPTMPGSADANAGGGPATVGSRAGSRITKIMPEARSNSLVIVATESAYLRILEVIREIDVPLEGEGGIHVHRVQNGDAEDIASTLSALIGGGGGGGGGRAAVGAQGGGGGNAAVSASGGGPSFEGEIRVTAHKPTNSLVITSSLHDYASLRSVIERLDAPRRQVFIEAVIMEMSVDRTRELGFSFHGGIPDTPVDDANMLGGFNAGTSTSFPLSPEALTGLALGIRGPDLNIAGLSIPSFGVVLNALAGSEDVNVLSTPHIIAIDNEEAEITVGQNVPLQNSAVGSLGSLGSLAGATGDQSSALAGLAGLSGFGGSAPRQDVGTTLRITPHINDADEVRLEIQEEISEPGAAPPQGNLGVISLNKRTAKTQVVVRDMQTVVIGGLMRDRITQSETKIPILGDIPLLGFLFRNEVTTTQKTNLLLFLTPYIIRDQSDLRAIYERKMRERQEFIDRYFVFGDQDYSPPIDYTRTRGLVSEIMNEIDGMLEEQRLLEEAALRPPPEHVPRPAIGAAPEGPSSGDVVITPEGTELVPSNPPDEAQPPPEGNIQIQIDPGVVDPNGQ